MPYCSVCSWRWLMGEPPSTAGAATQPPLQSYPQSAGSDRRPARSVTTVLWLLQPASSYVVRPLSNARPRLSRYPSFMHRVGPAQLNVGPTRTTRRPCESTVQ